MAVYTGTMFEARKDFGAVVEGNHYELIMAEDADYLIDSDTGDVFEVRTDAYDDDVVFLRDNPKIKFDKVVLA